jgi:hypothetical protein
MKHELRLYSSDDLETVMNLPLRKHDYEECQATTGLTDSKDILLQCLVYSKITWVGLYQGKIECVFGLGEQSKDIGIPWFLSTDKFNEFKLIFGRESIKVVQTMLTLYPFLTNIIDSRNTESIKWLKWLGFYVDINHPVYLLGGHCFYKFSMSL